MMTKLFTAPAEVWYTFSVTENPSRFIARSNLWRDLRRREVNGEWIDAQYDHNFCRLCALLIKCVECYAVRPQRFSSQICNCPCSCQGTSVSQALGASLCTWRHCCQSTWPKAASRCIAPLRIRVLRGLGKLNPQRLWGQYFMSLQSLTHYCAITLQFCDFQKDG